MFKPPPGTASGRATWGLMLLAIMAGLLLRTIAITQKTALSHDEGISYLAATANQGAYEQVKVNRVYPYGSWVTASEWQTFLVIRERFAFSQISYDLAESDVHPPLYFWLLHLWAMIFAVHPWTGPTLNLLLFLGSAAALYHLACRLLQNSSEAAFVTAIWAISPALIDITLTARQYELLGLCTILFIWSLLSYMDTTLPHSWPRWLLLILTTAAGASTHFHFALVVAGAVLIFVLPHGRSALPRLLAAIGGIGTGYLLFLLLHPSFLRSLQTLAFRQNEAAQVYWTALDFMRRFYATAFTHTRFWVYGGIAQAALFCLFTSFAIWLVMVFLRNRAGFWNYLRQGNLTGIEGVYYFFWITIITAVLYLTLLSPINAMTPRHMSLAWPFAPFLPVMLLRFGPPRGRQWLPGLLIAIVLLSGMTMVYFDYSGKSAAISADHFDLLVVDSVHDGILPRIVRQIPEQTPVFAADQSYLLAQPEAWLPQLTQESGYISDLSYANTPESKAAIIEFIAQSLGVAIEEVPGRFDGGMVYGWQVQSP
jgi:uncharacterized membrane protein